MQEKELQICPASDILVQISKATEENAMPEWKEKTFKKGEIIYRQNDYEAWMYDIEYGSVALYQNYGKPDEVRITALIGDGYFGEIELVEARQRTTTAVALEKTLVRVITAEDFGALFTEKPAMVMSIMQQMSARIRELTRQYLEACRVVTEAVDAERDGREKSRELQDERARLVEIYRAYNTGSR